MNLHVNSEFNFRVNDSNTYKVSKGTAEAVGRSGFGSLKSRIKWSESDTRFNFAVRTDEPSRLFKKLWVEVVDQNGHKVWANKNSIINRLGDSHQLRELLKSEQLPLIGLFEAVQKARNPSASQRSSTIQVASNSPVNQAQQKQILLEQLATKIGESLSAQRGGSRDQKIQGELEELYGESQRLGMFRREAETQAKNTLKERYLEGIRALRMQHRNQSTPLETHYLEQLRELGLTTDEINARLNAKPQNG